MDAVAALDAVDLSTITLVIDERGPDKVVPTIESFADIFRAPDALRVHATDHELEAVAAVCSYWYQRVEAIAAALLHNGDASPEMTLVHTGLRRALLGFEGAVLPGIEAALATFLDADKVHSAH